MTSDETSRHVEHAHLADDFAARHIGPGEGEVEHMLRRLGHASLDALTEAAVPRAIAWTERLDLPEAVSEPEVLAQLRTIAAANTVRRSMIGLGYHGTHTPGVITRNVLENPSWYTAYTPYQPEISQGRLEALLNFQTAVSDLTGMTTANASMLDEATAAAEAATLMRRAARKPSDDAVLVVDTEVLPQTLAVVRTRMDALGLGVLVHDTSAGLPDVEVFGVLLQYPGASGVVRDLAPVAEEAHSRDALVTVAADLLALTLLRAPGEMGADVAVGTSQRFGVPMGFGGPHAGYMAVRAGLERSLPGRLVGVSVDAVGAPAYRLALQTREQHIRREKATSNICTAQVLLAVMASMYAVYHGPAGLRAIAERVHSRARALAAMLADSGVEVVHDAYFDTLLVRSQGRADDLVQAAYEAGYLLRRIDADHVSLACDETTTDRDVQAVVGALTGRRNRFAAVEGTAIPDDLRRTSEYLTHPVFSAHQSETAMLRYLKRLADKDYALDRGMIPLGSCTMKLNATAEMEAITWPEFADLHPFAPQADTEGSRALVADLERRLVEITGYDAVSLQPNAGSQGELAGLLAIRAFHRANGDEARDICLIPVSAHGTNAASAVMAGLRVLAVQTDGFGNVDTTDLKAKVEQHRDTLAALMITYPSTHGVFEEAVADICALVHDAGGQVYVDGANLNALVGLAKPGKFGADVSHLNLHKTFCIPHGGGGPGVGPVGVREHLAPFLPSVDTFATDAPVGPVSAAPYGSAGILPISWAYIAMMGAGRPAPRHPGRRPVGQLRGGPARRALPGALHRSADGLVAHECILDLRPITKATGVTVDDVAKRLIDYGFHAPTMSFPVAGTLMVEPTESEDLAELDRFCDAMIAIRAEIDRVAGGEWDAADSPLRHAPHTAESLTGDWDHPYTRAEAVYPGATDRVGKYWPPVRRIDGAYGDRNLVCSCPPISELAD